MNDYYRPIKRKANKNHICQGCGVLLPKGEFYLEVTMQGWYGNYYTEAWCYGDCKGYVNA